MNAPTKIASLSALALAGLTLAGCATTPAASTSPTAPATALASTSAPSLDDIAYVLQAKCGDEPRNTFISLEAAWTRSDLPDGCTGITYGGTHFAPEDQAIIDAHPSLGEDGFLAAYGACAYADLRPYFAAPLEGELAEQARASLEICPTNPAAAQLQTALGA